MNNLEDEDVITRNNIISAEDELKKLQEDSKNDMDNLTFKKEIESAENKLNSLEKCHITLKTQISEKNEDITNLDNEKDHLIKKCLMKLHAEMKKDHRQINKDHEKYVELYTKAREERHMIERKMMNLKVLVYKNYKIRLV